MIIRRIESKGLAHYSYAIADQKEMFVIDPRRDIGEYLRVAQEEGAQIIGIFETHRNEDIISGSLELSERTGAPVYISGYEDLDYCYGEKIKEDRSFSIGEGVLKPVHTPGHTLGHLSYLLELQGEPFAIFSGDALFYGDVGRTDFYGEKAVVEMTEALYDSLQRIMELPDDVLLYPAHGEGSACGGSIESRSVSTLGLEKKHFKALSTSREAFVETYAKMRYKPLYFEKIEQCNLTGAPLPKDRSLQPLHTIEIDQPKTIIDLRENAAYFGEHIHYSTFIRLSMISSYLGWIYTQETPLRFLADSIASEDLNELNRLLYRMGYDEIEGYYPTGSFRSMRIDGADLKSSPPISAKDFIEQIDRLDVLDVRKIDEEREEEKNFFKHRLQIPLQELKPRLSELENKHYFILCGSGERATIAASLLEQEGIDATVISGGIHGLRKALAQRDEKK